MKWRDPNKATPSEDQDILFRVGPILYFGEYRPKEKLYRNIPRNNGWSPPKIDAWAPVDLEEIPQFHE